MNESDVVSLPSCTYVNDPLAFSENDEACEGALTRTAVSDPLSTSVSLPRTPGAETLSVPPSLTLYESLFATGASSTATTLIVDVATLLRLLTEPPSSTCHETVRDAVDGLSEVLKYFTERSAD